MQNTNCYLLREACPRLHDLMLQVHFIDMMPSFVSKPLHSCGNLYNNNAGNKSALMVWENLRPFIRSKTPGMRILCFMFSGYWPEGMWMLNFRHLSEIACVLQEVFNVERAAFFSRTWKSSVTIWYLAITLLPGLLSGCEKLHSMCGCCTGFHLKIKWK